MIDDATYHGGAGTPLVLIHGLSSSGRIWKPVLAELEEAHEVFVITLPGHRGGPAGPSGRTGISEITDVVEGQLDELGIQRAHLVGNSLGGAVVLELARRGRAFSVVGISAAGGWRSRFDIWRLVTLFKAGQLGLRGPTKPAIKWPTLRRFTFKLAMERSDLMPEDEFVDFIDDALGCDIVDGVTEAIKVDGTMPALDAGEVPIVLAWGQHDRLLPYKRYGASLRDRIANVEVVMLPGAGHVPMYDETALVTATILRVAARADRAATGEASTA